MTTINRGNGFPKVTKENVEALEARLGKTVVDDEPKTSKKSKKD